MSLRPVDETKKKQEIERNRSFHKVMTTLLLFAITRNGDKKRKMESWKDEKRE